MADLITLTCPSCGAPQITIDKDRFVCAHCGAEHVVRHGAGLVSPAPVVAELLRVRMAVDRAASELAIPRLASEIGELRNQQFRFQAATWLTLDTNHGCLLVVGALLLSALSWWGLARILESLAAPSGWGFYGGAMVFCLVCTAHCWGRRRRVRDAERARQEYDARISEQIWRRQDEIAKHRRILAGWASRETCARSDSAAKKTVSSAKPAKQRMVIRSRRFLPGT